MNERLFLGGILCAAMLAAGCAGADGDASHDVGVAVDDGTVAPRCLSQVEEAYSATHAAIDDGCGGNRNVGGASGGGGGGGGWGPGFGVDLSGGDPTGVGAFVKNEGDSPGKGDQAAGEAEVCSVANTQCVSRCQALPVHVGKGVASARTACLAACKESYATCTGKK